MRGQLSLQRPLQHRLHQPAQHRVRTSQPELPGLVPGLGQQQIQQLITEQVPDRHIPALAKPLTHLTHTRPDLVDTLISPDDSHDRSFPPKQ